MSEEEKQAIKILKEAIELYEDNCYISIDEDFKAIEIILNLVEKTQKEIEEYKKRLTPTPDNYVPIEYQMIGYVDKRGYISKDKIKEKIEEINNEKLNYSEDEYYLENEIKGYAVDKLKELLGDE